MPSVARPTPEERKRVRLDTRRRLILEAAAAEFAAVGFERATLGGIGERVGLSKASLYHYVESKEELFVALVEQVVRNIEASATKRANKSKDPIVRLRAFVHAHIDVALTSAEGKLLAANLDMFVSHATAAAPKKRHEAALRNILRDGVAKGQLADVPLAPVVKLTFGMLNAVPLWFDPKGALSVEAVADLVLAMLLEGLARPRKDPSAKIPRAKRSV